MQRLTSSVLTHLLALPLFAGVHRLVSLAFQAADGCLEVTDQMKVIAATRDITESELLASAEAAAAISDYGLRCKTGSTSSSSRMPQVSASRCSSQLSR